MDQIQNPPVPPKELLVSLSPLKLSNRIWAVLKSVIFVLMSIGLVFLGFQNYILSQKLDKALSQIPTSSPEISPLPTSTPTISITQPPKQSLSDALSRNCVDNKILLDNLPFTLSPKIKLAYKVENSLECFVPDGNYASMSLRTNQKDFSGTIRSVYFLHQNSRWVGMGDPFAPLESYLPVTLNGRSYYMKVYEPGPYGISSLELWIDIISEKKDAATGTVVRAVGFNVVKDQKLLDLVMKYGTQTTGEGTTIYVIKDPSKKTQFLNELVLLVPTLDVLKASAQNVDADLDGVLF